MEDRSKWVLLVATGMLSISVLLSPMILCGLGVVIPVWANNVRLDRFAENLFDYPLPPGTEEVDRQAHVRLMGNGNHCDFEARRSLLTELSRAEIEAYYRDLTLPAVDSSSHGRIEVQVQFHESQQDGRLHFTVELVDVGYPPGFDIRCH